MPTLSTALSDLLTALDAPEQLPAAKRAALSALRRHRKSHREREAGRKPGYTKGDPATVRALSKQGKSVREIAAACGLSGPTVRSYLKS